MNRINFEDIKEKIASKDKIIILSTDIDLRFNEACEILKNEVPNIEYRLIDKQYIDNHKSKEKLFNLYKELRGHKEDIAFLEKNFNNPNLFATLMVKIGLADGIVSGATHPTSEILRPAFQIIKAKVNNEIISSFNWMSKIGEDDMFMADVSVIPNPNSNQLAQIAIQTAKSIKSIFNLEPVIAMLSFSTNGSGGKQDSIIKVQEATKIVRNAGFEVYGDIQWDAATERNVFSQKMKLSPPTQMPNIFIFPNLDAGNIGYKIASGVGEYSAVGPILQNIDKPINDLSRSCTPREIADLVIVTSLQILNK